MYTTPLEKLSLDYVDILSHNPKYESIEQAQLLAQNAKAQA